METEVRVMIKISAKALSTSWLQRRCDDRFAS